MNEKYQILYDKLVTRRNNVLMGKVNCIPSPFVRFSNDFVGIEQGKTVIVSANSKVGKTQLTNYMFVYNPLFYAFKNPDKVRIKILYFNLEETEENITLRFISHLLFAHPELQIPTVRIGTKDLRSTYANKPLSDEVLNVLKNNENFTKVMDFYYKCVEFRPERHPTGIKKAIESFLLENGTIHYKKIKLVDKETGRTEEINAFDYYEPKDPDLYIIPIVDHFALLNSESGLSTKQTMDLMSAYFVKLRNRYNITPVEVIQQAAEMESTENFKQKRLRPTAQGIGESKTLVRDCDIMLGLFSPFRHEIANYLGYDILRFRNHIRFLEVVVNREGEQNSICPLYFDGMTNTFQELPKPNDPELEKYYNQAKQLNILITKLRKRNTKLSCSKILKRWKNTLLK